MASHGTLQEGDHRERTVFAWLPVRCNGRWCWLREYQVTERFVSDYSGWSTGVWLTVERSLR